MQADGERWLLSLIADDGWMMEVLTAAASLALPDWWIGAGFVRGKAWDALHGYRRRTPLADVDVVYFDPGDLSRAAERRAEQKLCGRLADVPWSVRNQARMHRKHGDAPYRDTEDALRHWLETPTCVAVTLRGDDTLMLVAPYGLDDLLAMVVRPTASARRRPEQYHERLTRKDWQGLWPRLTVLPASA